MSLAAFLWGVIGFSVLLIINAVFRLVRLPRQKAINEHHELNWKLTNKGLDTSSLKTAKECFHELSSSYESIKSYVNANARSCYEDNIEEIRQNAECIAEEKWRKKANSFLLKIEQAYDTIACYDFQTVEKAYQSKNILIKAYDDLFDWTRMCCEENRDIWKDVNVWDEAKENVSAILERYDHYVLWNDRAGSDATVRQQLIATLDRRIEMMRPECQRKTKLRSLIMQKIANQGTVQRSHLLKGNFDGFVAGEINACYQNLVKEHAVIEYKQGAVYFVILSDAAAKKYTPDKEANQKPTEEKSQPARTEEAEKGNRSIDSVKNLLYRELIRHFGEEGIEYIDKTANGGSLYFFSETEADTLKKKDYPVFFAENGTKGTAHRPAWYIKL